MSEKNTQPIVIKRIKKVKEGAHGGAWKLAYADFVTAMMAFFMLMWLLSLLNKYQLQGVSEYFKRPLKEFFTSSNAYDDNKTTMDESRIENTEQEKIKFVLPVMKTSTSKEVPEHDTDEQHVASQQKEKEARGGEQEKLKPTERDALEQFKNQLEVSFKNNPAINQFKENLNVEIVEDGLKLSLHDTKANPMFTVGGAELKNPAKKIITWLSGEFNRIPKQIRIIGHTDTIKYHRQANYTNWELSSDRASAARELLVRKGMAEDKVLRIEGAADINLTDKQHGENPVNRSVDIVVLTNKAAEKLMDE